MLRERLSRVGAIATLGVLAACGTTTTPDIVVELDTDAAIEDYEALATALGSSDLVGFRALGARTPFGGAPAAIDVMAGMTAPAVTRRRSARTPSTCSDASGPPGPRTGPWRHRSSRKRIVARRSFTTPSPTTTRSIRSVRVRR